MLEPAIATPVPAAVKKMSAEAAEPPVPGVPGRAVLRVHVFPPSAVLKT
jgi:hypothetical protein